MRANQFYSYIFLLIYANWIIWLLSVLNILTLGCLAAGFEARKCWTQLHL